MGVELTKPLTAVPPQFQERSQWTSGSAAIAEISPMIVVIERRVLIRECLAQCFVAAFGGNVVAFPSVSEWRDTRGLAKTPASPTTVVLSTGGRSRDNDAVKAEISLLSRDTGPLLLILLADAEEPSQIVDALERGARGYIATSSSMAIAIEAIRLVRAGGVYVPAGSLMTANRHSGGEPGEGHGVNGEIARFTHRQSAVLEALRKGMSNKNIAHHLNLRESTVKVHIRSIMRKLGAKNRTEVAYLAQNQSGHEGS